ncbi:MAG: thioredoxin [Flavobacteriaceae bacterium]|nr:thioredoxin [Flavobacteriaceae bacterium]
MNKFLFIISLFLFSCSNDTKLTAEKFLEGINSSKINLIDVRTYDEFASGHIPNAINIDFNNFSEFQENINLIEKDKPTYIYCLSGGRSAKAYSYLKEIGFNNLYELDGGILDWRKNKFSENNLLKPTDEFNLDQFNGLLNADKLVMISFNAKWCAPCIKMKPFLEKIAEEESDNLIYYPINYDNNKGLMNELEIYSLPTINFYKNKKLVFSINEYSDEQSLKKVISKLI